MAQSYTEPVDAGAHAVPARRPHPLALAAALGLLLALAAAAWLPRAGTFLVLRDPLAPADAIVVLAGNAPQRLRHGLELYHAGYAPLLLVSNERVRTHGLDTSWLDLYRAGRSAPDLPPSALLVLDDPPPENTVDEARRSAALLRERGLTSAILVTDPFHSRRSALLFGTEYRRHGIAIRSSPAEVDELGLDAWWRQRRAFHTVLQEYIKLLFYLPQGAYW